MAGDPVGVGPSSLELLGTILLCLTLWFSQMIRLNQNSKCIENADDTMGFDVMLCLLLPSKEWGASARLNVPHPFRQTGLRRRSKLALSGNPPLGDSLKGLVIISLTEAQINRIQRRKQYGRPKPHSRSLFHLIGDFRLDLID